MNRRFRDPSPEEIEALTLEAMQESIMSQLRPENLEVSIVGDVDASEVKPDSCREALPEPTTCSVQQQPVMMVGYLRPASNTALMNCRLRQLCCNTWARWRHGSRLHHGQSSQSGCCRHPWRSAMCGGTCRQGTLKSCDHSISMLVLWCRTSGCCC